MAPKNLFGNVEFRACGPFTGAVDKSQTHRGTSSVPKSPRCSSIPRAACRMLKIRLALNRRRESHKAPPAFRSAD